MPKYLIIMLCVLTILGCKSQYTYFEDGNGRDHCRDSKTGEFVNMELCK